MTPRAFHLHLFPEMISPRGQLIERYTPPSTIIGWERATMVDPLNADVTLHALDGQGDLSTSAYAAFDATCQS